MSGRRSIALLLVIAVLSAAVGWLAGTRLKSPAQVAAEAEPPEASRITAPVEAKSLSTNVVTRGDVISSDAVDLIVPGGEGDSIVTSPPPALDDVIEEGTSAIEIAGRPVLVLGGDLPAYRALRPQAEGPDVVQLQQALVRLGHLAPEAASGTYGPETEGAIEALYIAAGYQAPKVDEADQERLEFAQDAVDTASEALGEAERPYEAARVAGEPLDGLERDLQRARVSLEEARVELAEVDAEVGVVLPRSEFVFVSGLPRAVRQIDLELGDSVTGPLMTLASADLTVSAAVTRSDRQYVQEGIQASLSAPELGIETTGTVSFVAENPGTDGASDERYRIRITPDDDAAELRGVNLKVTIPVSSTDGEVLAVPIAALSSSADEQARVEVERADLTVELVDVEPGLSAGGFVEVAGEIEEGDRVVVGSSAGTASAPGGDNPADGGGDPADGGDETADGGGNPASGDNPAGGGGNPAGGGDETVPDGSGAEEGSTDR